MTFDQDPGSPIFTRMEDDLEAEFPGWVVTREDSGRWSAVRPSWGALYGQSVTELRDRLLKFTDVEGWQ
jgi:hypothetical protein